MSQIRINCNDSFLDIIDKINHALVYYSIQLKKSEPTSYEDNYNFMIYNVVHDDNYDESAGGNVYTVERLRQKLDEMGLDIK